MRWLFYLILCAGIGNTVLRPELENPYTLYRLIAPLGLLAVFAERPLLVLKCSIGFAAFAAYNFLLAALYGGGYSQFLPSLVHYLYLFVLLVLMIDMKQRDAHFDDQFLRFVRGFYGFLLLNLLAEFFVGSYYPNLYTDETDESSLRAFFWNQNDLAVVLCVVGWFALTLNRFRGPERIAVALLTMVVLYYNDSKAALISFVFVSLPIYLIFRACAKVKIEAKVWFVLFGSAIMAFAAAVVSLRDTGIGFANDTYTIDDLLVRPILNIVTLQASGEEWGSLNNRTDAAIFVVIEYLRSYGIGLGAGGSWLVLSLPQYELGGAKSPHNALLQFVVDFGYPVLLGYLWLVGWALRRLFRHRLGEAERLKVIAILSFPMLGLSQSGAIVTNYFFFAAVYFIWMYGRPAPFSAARSRPRHRIATRRAPASGPTGAAIVPGSI